MTLRNYQVFVEVCNQGTMSAAAQKLFISQSAISQIIREMEEHYGVTLFRRVAHKLYLTEAGKKLYSHAIKMVQYNELIEVSMADTSTNATLRIGSVSAYIMLDILAEYKKIHPDVSVSMVHNTRSVLDMLLYSSQLDVVIASGIFNLNNYDFFPLIEFDTVFACRKETQLSPFLFGNSPEISLQELSQFPIYLCAVSEDTEQSLNSAFTSLGIHYNVAGTFLDYNSLIEAAQKDLGIILINKTVFDREDHQLKLVKVKDFNVNSRIFLICSREMSADPVIRGFVDFALNNFEKIKSSYTKKHHDPYSI